MPRAIVKNGALVAAEAATVSIFDRGFLYGDGLFEVMRTYDGHLFALEDHLTRLEQGASRLAIGLGLPRSGLAAEVRLAVAEAGGGDLHVRIVITRGVAPAGLEMPQAAEPTRIVVAQPLDQVAPEIYSRGISLAIVRGACGSPRGVKATSYLPNLLALREARGKGADEALLESSDGRIVEGARSNVFVVRAGVLTTPPVEDGPLPGITRARVIALATERGMLTRLSSVRAEDVYGADEVFVTSSVREIVPAVALEGSRIGGGRPGPVARALHEAYRAAIPGAARVPLERR